jgi:heterodisulfide reductase subunit C
MYAERYGNRRKVRQCLRQLPAHLRAKRCENCAGCTLRCAYGVRVREQVSRAQSPAVLIGRTFRPRPSRRRPQFATHEVGYKISKTQYTPAWGL